VSISNAGSVVNAAAIPANPQAMISTSRSGVGTPTFNLTWSYFSSLDGGLNFKDEDWTLVVVANNIAYSGNHGTAIASFHDPLIAGNHVINSGLVANSTSREGHPSSNVVYKEQP
jgi:hypothetical protein